MIFFKFSLINTFSLVPLCISVQWFQIFCFLCVENLDHISWWALASWSLITFIISIPSPKSPSDSKFSIRPSLGSSKQYAYITWVAEAFSADLRSLSSVRLTSQHWWALACKGLEYTSSFLYYVARRNCNFIDVRVSRAYHCDRRW